MSEQPPPVCWICGASADSSEHRIKRTDLTRVYGAGPYRGDFAPVHVREGIQRPIRSPGAATLKYQPSLCRRCNTASTQPFDRAYERLIEWLFVNEASVLRIRLLDFGDIYGHDFEDAQRDLFKYFVKSFGCRLVDAGREVPRDLVELMPKEEFATRLAITFCVNEDILLLPPWRSGFIGKSDLVEFVSSESTPSFQWKEHVSWFTTCYWYALSPESRLGPKWIADAQVVYLGSWSPLTEEERRELMAKVKGDESNAEGI